MRRLVPLRRCGPLHSRPDLLDMMQLATQWNWIQGDDSGEEGPEREVDADPTETEEQANLKSILELLIEVSDPQLSPFFYRTSEVRPKQRPCLTHAISSVLLLKQRSLTCVPDVLLLSLDCKAWGPLRQPLS